MSDARQSQPSETQVAVRRVWLCPKRPAAWLISSGSSQATADLARPLRPGTNQQVESRPDFCEAVSTFLLGSRAWDYGFSDFIQILGRPLLVQKLSDGLSVEN